MVIFLGSSKQFIYSKVSDHEDGQSKYGPDVHERRFISHGGGNNIIYYYTSDNQFNHSYYDKTLGI